MQDWNTCPTVRETEAQRDEHPTQTTAEPELESKPELLLWTTADQGQISSCPALQREEIFFQRFLIAQLATRGDQ